MPSIPDVSNLQLVIAFVLPGFIASYIRSQFLHGRWPRPSEALLVYLTLSALYLAIVTPLVGLAAKTSPDSIVGLLAWFGLVFVGPVVLGVALGLGARASIVHRVAHRLGLQTVHPMPTAWDYRFSGGKPGHLLVRLKDGTKFAGYCSDRSFTSSDPLERDILIEQIYEIGDDNKWVIQPGKSALVAGGEISTIEFFEEAKQHGEQ
jgi:hypothetical protein